MRPRRFPEHMLRAYGTHRNFKHVKRQQLRAIKKALSDFQTGSWYLDYSAYLMSNEIQDKVRQLERQLTVKVWGR